MANQISCICDICFIADKCSEAYEYHTEYERIFCENCVPKTNQIPEGLEIRKEN